jgi:hypothetical protein
MPLNAQERQNQRANLIYMSDSDIYRRGGCADSSAGKLDTMGLPACPSRLLLMFACSWDRIMGRLLLSVPIALSQLAISFISPAQTINPPSRTFALTYQVHVPAEKDANGRFLMWLPLPQQDEYQKIRDLQINSDVAHSLGRDSEYKNSYVLFEPTHARSCCCGCAGSAWRPRS